MLKLHHNRGFTLVELIMTIAIVGVVAIPTSLFLAQHLQSSFQSKDMTMAVELARLEMEKVKNLDYTNIISANYSQYQGYSYDVTRTVTFAQGDEASPESLKQIKVEVTKAGGVDVLISIVTYLSKNIGYGV